jgi:hypothetical protein
LTLCSLFLISCGPSEQEKEKQKALNDSSISATVNATVKQNKIDELKSSITSAEAELTSLNNDPDYLGLKKKLETVRARVSTGGSYGWIDKDGEFWEGADANKAFDAAAAREKDQLAKVEAKKSEIQAFRDKLKGLEG